MMDKISIIVLLLAATTVAIKAILIDELRASTMNTVIELKRDLRYFANVHRGYADPAALFGTREDCVRHTMSQYVLAIKALRYKAGARYLSAAGAIIDDRFGSINNRQAMRDSFARRGEPIERYIALAGRAWLRAMADSVRISRVMMGLLLLTARDNPEMKSIFNTAGIDLQDEMINSWQHRMDYHYHNLQQLIHTGVSSGKLPSNITAILDDELDLAMNFHEREYRVIEPELYNTYPAFPNHLVIDFMKHEMESRIGFKMTRCEGVRNFEQSEVDAVVQEQIDVRRRGRPLRLW